MNRDAVLVPLPGFEPLAASVTGMDIVDSILAVWLKASRLIRGHSIAPLLAEALAQSVTLQVND